MRNKKNKNKNKEDSQRKRNKFYKIYPTYFARKTTIRIFKNK